jgi:hypothetical protein
MTVRRVETRHGKVVTARSEFCAAALGSINCSICVRRTGSGIQPLVVTPITAFGLSRAAESGDPLLHCYPSQSVLGGGAVRSTAGLGFTTRSEVVF